LTSQAPRIARTKKLVRNRSGAPAAPLVARDGRAGNRASSGRPERTDAQTPSLAAEAARRSAGTSP
jgi:hypothetical protein